MPIISNKIEGIIGPKGSGKTHLAAEQFGSENRALVYQIVRSNTEYDVYATHITDDVITATRIMRKEDSFRIVYKVPDSDIVEKGKELIYTSLTPIVQEAYLEGNMTLYLDEAHEFCSQWSIPFHLRKTFRLARNQSLNIVWVSQGMEVHREIRRNTDEFKFFCTSEPGDLDKIEERCGPETRNRVETLQRLTEDKHTGKIIPGEHLIWRAYE